MKRKKIIALASSALVAVLLVGGTLAYFKSTDQEENKFATVGKNDPDNGSDIDIVEYFPEAKEVTPGTVSTKMVQVKNTDNYNQLIKVRFEVAFLDDNNEVTDATEQNGVTLDDLKANLNLELTNLYNGNEEESKGGKWFADCTDLNDNAAKFKANYYYLNAVPENGFTSKILNSVKLEMGAGNEYQGLKYEVKVIADGIQASNQAYKEAGWTTIDENNKDKLYSYLEYAQESPYGVEKEALIEDKKDN
ncbi:MAG: BsaA family SipW-dependent biofilm matrix protein [Clostridium sp.]|uniref:BsaA family SipW-dependent biofilm matrix protein n=1 Tax=Clostridium sp. DSM 8431 TaxID=1761781 RepID=UPI0008DF3591|nr:BsaA family SipW-dependent biofilm matrix protein [Clostridium sp. DSM 8431]MCR4944370.1 BsaA family SipW-dependent biofilm matrix protein [Clostridium sp.]SFU40946.1 alternate signal-mediated exported protein, CPF_0494 family [Clostridium sp. DSM 8431]